MHKGNWKKLFTLLGLYIAQSVPMSFFSTVVPVIMRQENYSLESIGMLQMIKLPWIIKFFWAPLIDRTSTSIKHYRKWIIYSEIFYAIIILSIGFFDLKFDFSLIILLMLIAFVGSATQDIATDAYAIHTLKPSERGIGNSMQSTGSFIGTLLGSGALLVLYHFFGWQILLICLAFFVLIALIPLYFFKSNRNISTKQAGVKPIRFSDIGYFFVQKGMAKRILFLFIFYSGIIGILAMIKPFLVDKGFSIKEIGIMSGVFGTSMGALSSVLAGVSVKQLGRTKSIRIATLLMLLAGVYMFVFTLGEVALLNLYLGIALVWSAYGFASVMIFTTSMDVVRKGREGTDFTLQIVITHISSMLIAIFSGKLADTIGYKGLFVAESILAFIVLLATLVLYKEPNSVRKLELE